MLAGYSVASILEELGIMDDVTGFSFGTTYLQQIVRTGFQVDATHPLPQNPLQEFTCGHDYLVCKLHSAHASSPEISRIFSLSSAASSCTVWGTTTISGPMLTILQEPPWWSIPSGHWELTQIASSFSQPCDSLEGLTLFWAAFPAARLTTSMKLFMKEVAIIIVKLGEQRWNTISINKN